MPEYVCAVAKVHKRLYGQPQSQTPVCCGKPMALTQGPSQTAAVASNPQALWTHEGCITIPQKEKQWWQLWK